MPITLPKRPGANPGPQQSNSQPTAPAPASTASAQQARPQPQQARPQPQQPAQQRAPSFGGRGLPPARPDIDTNRRGGGGFEKRNDEYWLAHPLRPGQHTFRVCYVNKIIAWASGGVNVYARVSDWDAVNNTPGEHHGRTIDWPQNPHPRLVERLASSDPTEREGAEKGYAFWRADIVRTYTGLGLPDTAWAQDADGNVEVPWPFFFVRQVGAVHVPICFSLTVSVTVPTSTRGSFINVIDGAQVTDSRSDWVQAPLPYEVPPRLAEQLRWPIAERKWIGKSGPQTEIAVLDRNAVEVPHAGMTTWKDL